MQRIGFIVFPGFQVMSFAVMSVFEFANLEMGEPVYEVQLLSETGGSVRTSIGMSITAATFDDANLDTLIVGGGTAIASGSDDTSLPVAVERAAARAYEQAGVGPGDIDLAEVHDAAAPAELQIYEELGLCAPGDGPALLASGATALGGRVPVNTSGGLLSKGHPVGATGARILTTLLREMDRREVRYGLETMCIGGGQGLAAIFENVNAA